MQLLCPRCDAPFSTHDAQCRACGYMWFEPCSSCGKPNIPAAHFCGRCGTSMSRSSRFWKEIQLRLSKPFGFSIRQIGTGFAFGGLLAFFAFGSLGMTSQQHRDITPSEARSGVSSPDQVSSPDGRDPLSGLRDWRSTAGEATEEASLKDLMHIGRKILDTLSPASHDCDTTDSTREVEKVRYLQGLRSGLAAEEGKPVKRSDVALFLYRIAGDILNVSLKSFPEANYTDIPRHHYMTVPIRTLESLHIRISRSDTVFGSNDTVTVADLGRIAADFLTKGELFLKATDEKTKKRKPLNRKAAQKASVPAPHSSSDKHLCKCSALHD